MKEESDRALQRTAVFVAAMASFMTPFMGSAVNIAVPAIGRQFSMNAVQLGWVATSYMLAAAVFLIPFSRMADIVGRKKVFTVGILVQTLGSLLAALAPSGALLLAFRVVQGVGGAMIFGTGVAILTSVFPPRERGRALGVNVAAVYLGLSLGPVIGGLLTQYLSWRAVFFVHLPIGAAVLVLIFWKLKGEWAEARGEGFDWAGAILYGLTLVALIVGLSRLPAPKGAWLIGASAAGLCVFVVWESRTAQPLLDIRLFRRNRVFAFSNLAALIHYSATACVGFLLSLHLQYIKGFSPRNAGLVLVVQPIMMALFSPKAGRLSDRVEPRIVASAGMGLTFVGLVLLTRLLNGQTPTALIALCLMLLGLGFALFSSPNTNAVMSSVERRHFGVASGTLSTMRAVGGMLSMGLVMLIFSWIIGPTQITQETPERFPAFVKSAKMALALASALCLVGTFASLARGDARKKEPSEEWVDRPEA